MPITPAFEDWRQRRDPILEAALAGFESATPPGGTWRGIVGFEWSRDSIAVQLAAPGTADTSRVSIPGFGVRDAVLEGAMAEPGRLAGMWRIGRHEARFEAVPAGRRLVGTVAYQGRRLPVVLEPVDAP